MRRGTENTSEKNMARVYLDTNIYIDAAYRNPQINNQLLAHEVYYSPLSTHILFYTFKLNIPQPTIDILGSKFKIVDLAASILQDALRGPTKDLEDNIQLHSAADAECVFFLTSDKKLLAMKFFGKAKIAETIKR